MPTALFYSWRVPFRHYRHMIMRSLSWGSPQWLHARKQFIEKVGHVLPGASARRWAVAQSGHSALDRLQAQPFDFHQHIGLSVREPSFSI